MMEKNIKKLLFLTAFFAIDTMAVTKSTSKFQNKFVEYSSKVNKIAAQIKSLDKRLAKTNDSYLVSLKEIEKIEKGMTVLKTELKTNAQKISSNYNSAKKALNLYLLESSDTESDEAVLHKKIYLEVLKKNIGKLKQAQKDSNELLETITIYDQKLTETKSHEEEVYNLIVELENTKKELSQNYITYLENKNQAEVELDKLKAKRKILAKKKVANKTKIVQIPFAMHPPLEQYLEIKQNKQAIVFKYKDPTAVNAPSAGKVVYTGELANYGNLIMIDHGSDVKSVILADMSIKIKKGESVKKGQVLGYTVSDPGMVKSLHYEIRKKSKAVNAYSWISKTNKKI